MLRLRLGIVVCFSLFASASLAEQSQDQGWTPSQAQSDAAGAAKSKKNSQTSGKKTKKDPKKAKGKKQADSTVDGGQQADEASDAPLPVKTATSAVAPLRTPLKRTRLHGDSAAETLRVDEMRAGLTLTGVSTKSSNDNGATQSIFGWQGAGMFTIPKAMTHVGASYSSIDAKIGGDSGFKFTKETMTISAAHPIVPAFGLGIDLSSITDKASAEGYSSSDSATILSPSIIFSAGSFEGVVIHTPSNSKIGQSAETEFKAGIRLSSIILAGDLTREASEGYADQWTFGGGVGFWVKKSLYFLIEVSHVTQANSTDNDLSYLDAQDVVSLQMQVEQAAFDLEAGVSYTASSGSRGTGDKTSSSQSMAYVGGGVHF